MLTAIFVSLRSIIMVELMGLQKLTNAFGLVIMFQGISSFVGAPIAGTYLFRGSGGYDSVQFSSVQDGIYALGKSHMCSTPSFRSFPNVGFETVQKNVRLIDDGLLSPFQGRSSSASSFHASLVQPIDSVMSLALCP